MQRQLMEQQHYWNGLQPVVLAKDLQPVGQELLSCRLKIQRVETSGRL